VRSKNHVVSEANERIPQNLSPKGAQKPACTFTWVPETLDGLFPDGQRWCLYQTNHRKGYPHYIGRVCATVYNDTKPGSEYVCEVGFFSTMHDAAEALLRSAQ